MPRLTRLVFMMLSPLVLGAQQPFPMKYGGSIGDLPVGAKLKVGPALVTIPGQGSAMFSGQDSGGKRWSFTTSTYSGAGWTTAWLADFDGNGRIDILVAMSFPGCGQCIFHTILQFLLFDRNQRPAPWVLETQLPQVPDAKFPYLPVVVRDDDGDQRAEFATIGCRREVGDFLEAVYEARDAAIVPKQNPRLASYVRAAGVRWGMPPRSWPRVEPVLGKQAGERILEVRTEDLKLSTGERTLPDFTVIDGPEGREISDRPAHLLKVFRYGYPVKAAGRRDHYVLWADGYSTAQPSRVRAEWQVFRAYKAATSFWEERHDTSSKFEVVNPAGVVRISHTAFDHTVSNESRLETPPDGHRLIAFSPLGDCYLAQWSRRSASGKSLFSLHGGQGDLVAASIDVPSLGSLVGQIDDELYFTAPGGAHQILRGRVRWIRE